MNKIEYLSASLFYEYLDHSHHEFFLNILSMDSEQTSKQTSKQTSGPSPDPNTKSVKIKKLQSDEEKKFFLDMKPFVIQAVNGTFMAFLSQEQFSQINDSRQITSILNMFLKIYLNMCWHSYGKKNDKYIVESFDKLLGYNLIKGSVCLIHWIDNIGMIMTGLLDLSNTLLQLRTMPPNEQRRLIDINLTFMYDVISADFSGIICTGTCNDKYDGKDIFSAVKR